MLVFLNLQTLSFDTIFANKGNIKKRIHLKYRFQNSSRQQFHKVIYVIKAESVIELFAQPNRLPPASQTKKECILFF